MEIESELISSWQMAESLAVAHMTELGYSDSRLTVSGADGGIDVLSTDGAAQVKHYTSGPVGRPDVQRLRGAVSPRGDALFYSLNGYSVAAIAYGDERNVALFSYDLRGSVRAENAVAEKLAARGHISIDRSLPTRARRAFESQLREFGQVSVDVASIALSLAVAQIESEMPILQSGTWTDLVNPETFGEFVQDVQALAAALEWVKEGDSEGRRLDEWTSGLIDFEALVQKLVRRLQMNYENLARAARSMRHEGQLGHGNELDADTARAHVERAANSAAE